VKRLAVTEDQAKALSTYGAQANAKPENLLVTPLSQLAADLAARWERFALSVATPRDMEAALALMPDFEVDPAKIDNRLKQAGQMASKGRFLAAPLLGLLESHAWEDGAAHANLMAQRLAAGIATRTAFTLAHPVEANAVFVRMPATAHAALNAAGWACYRFDDGSVRFVCSWATTEGAVDEVLEAIACL
jgi:threonine aldolase